MGILHLNSLHLSAYVIHLYSCSGTMFSSVAQDWLFYRSSHAMSWTNIDHRKHWFQRVHNNVAVCVVKLCSWTKHRTHKIINPRILIWTVTVCMSFIHRRLCVFVLKDNCLSLACCFSTVWKCIFMVSWLQNCSPV